MWRPDSVFCEKTAETGDTWWIKEVSALQSGKNPGVLPEAEAFPERAGRATGRKAGRKQAFRSISMRSSHMDDPSERQNMEQG